MIYDTKNHLLQYKGISRNLDIAINYLLQNDISGLTPGKYPINGDSVFLMIQEMKPLPRKLAKWESHRKYVDIQYLIQGKESIGFQKTDSLKVKKSYSETNDITFYEDNGNGFFVDLQEDSFVVCFPTDAHMPLVGNANTAIKKAVIKVEV